MSKEAQIFWFLVLVALMVFVRSDLFPQAVEFLWTKLAGLAA